MADDERPILAILSQSPPGEAPQKASLRQDARNLISNDSQNTSLPDTLLALLAQILKPLFSASQHPSLTSTGRRNLLPRQPNESRLFTDFSALGLDDEPAWSTPWTLPLLSHVLSSYDSLPRTERRSSIETHFHLLVPPVLNILDSPIIAHKVAGMDALRCLSGILVSVESDLLRRTGLFDVFVDALKSNFSMLPTLTAEHDSLSIMRALYPAWFGLVDARFQRIRDEIVLFATEPSQRPLPPPPPSSSQLSTPSTSTTPLPSNSTPQQPTKISHPAQTVPPPDSQSRPSTTLPTPSTDLTLRTKTLTTLYRHSLLHGLQHLNQSSTLPSTTSLSLTLFFLSQIPPVQHRLGIFFAPHLQSTVPMLCSALRDPFVLSGVGLATAVVRALDSILRAFQGRVRERWWGEALAGAVGCWNALDGDQPSGDTEVRELRELLRALVGLLGQIMGEEQWDAVHERVVREDPELEGLFS